MASLFQACKAAVRNKEGGTFNIGGYDIDIEMYSQQDIDDDIQYGDVAFGDSDESKIVLVANDTITIPAGYTLTSDKPKKSLVIFCNTLMNNGTISMYQKAPNVLPHDYYIIQGSIIGSNKNVIIPAYANNQRIDPAGGNNGTNRQCGSGGCSDWAYFNSLGNHTYSRYATPGSGYAFGGGAGSGGIVSGKSNYSDDPLVPGQDRQASVNSTYPMRGGNAYSEGIEGIGNPNGNHGSQYQSHPKPSSGCGGRIIIFCSNFINNGNITVNGTNQINSKNTAYGGASGAGAVDLFYTNLNEQGNITANGGTGPYAHVKGGNGSITLTQWNLDKVIKEERKMFTKDNWVYLFSNYSQRLREDVI